MWELALNISPLACECLRETGRDRFSESKGNVTVEGDHSLTTQKVNYVLPNQQKSQ